VLGPPTSSRARGTARRIVAGAEGRHGSRPIDGTGDERSASRKGNKRHRRDNRAWEATEDATSRFKTCGPHSSCASRPPLLFTHRMEGFDTLFHIQAPFAAEARASGLPSYDNTSKGGSGAGRAAHVAHEGQARRMIRAKNRPSQPGISIEHGRRRGRRRGARNRHGNAHRAASASRAQALGDRVRGVVRSRNEAKRTSSGPDPRRRTGASTERG